MNLLVHVRNTLASDFLSPAGYFFWGWVLLYVFLGVGVFAAGRRKQGRGFSLGEALKSCFPAKTFWGPSAKLDYKIILFSHYLILYPVGLVLALNQDKLAAQVAPWVSSRLSFLSAGHVPLSNGFWVDAVYTVFLLFAADLGWTVQHILFHRVAFLWEFHKLHHSATELNIFTIARLHPVDTVTQAWAAGLAGGVFMGLCKALLGVTPSLVLFMNVSWAMAAFRVFGIYRHSHVWISYGRIASHVFCSPAMHQIHHGMDEKHRDKNFAVVFSFWDLVFGTIYVPREKEVVRFGIHTEGLRRQWENSCFGSLFHPFFPDRVLERYALWSEKRRERSSVKVPL